MTSAPLLLSIIALVVAVASLVMQAPLVISIILLCIAVMLISPR